MKGGAARRRGKKSKDEVVAAADFKARCLSLFDEVERGRSFVVTKRGRPVARVVPMPTSGSTSLVGSLLHEDDLLSPLDAEWDINK